MLLFTKYLLDLFAWITQNKLAFSLIIHESLQTMNILIFTRNNIKFALAVTIVICSIIFRKHLQFYYDIFLSNNEELQNFNRNGVITPKQLAEYNGINKNKLYLAIMGTIFDVTKSRKHYDSGASYHYFVGKDGSRAFVTGNFNDESDHKDHILDLTCDNLLALLNWNNTLRGKYKHVGIVIGRFYDHNGEETEYSKQFKERIKQCEDDRIKAKKEEQNYPPCNMEWSADSGSRVWCTKTSGGVPRSWVGLPRQLYTPGEKNPRCVCINPEKDHSLQLLKDYSNCAPTDTHCTIENS